MMHTLKSDLLFPKITWCEIATARTVKFILATSGRWDSLIFNTLAGGRTLPTQPNDGKYQAASPEIRIQLLNIVATSFRGDIANLHIVSIYKHLCLYDEDSQQVIIDLINSERNEMKEQIVGSVPADVLARLEVSLLEVKNRLEAGDPLISNHLRNSHQILISYPETVHLLDDAEIANLIGAAQLHTKIEIVKATAPKTARAVAKKASVDDF